MTRTKLSLTVAATVALAAAVGVGAAYASDGADNGDDTTVVSDDTGADDLADDESAEDESDMVTDNRTVANKNGHMVDYHAAFGQQRASEARGLQGAGGPPDFTAKDGASHGKPAHAGRP